MNSLTIHHVNSFEYAYNKDLFVLRITPIVLKKRGIELVFFFESEKEYLEAKKCIIQKV